MYKPEEGKNILLVWKIMKQVISNGEKIICPICGKTEFEQWGDYDTCPICGWFNDGVQYEEHDYAGGCNKMSVNQYKKAWEAGEHVE